MKGVCSVCQRIDVVHECVSCGAKVCLACVGRDGCKACRTRPKK